MNSFLNIICRQHILSGSYESFLILYVTVIRAFASLYFHHIGLVYIVICIIHSLFMHFG
jgi:hypothetical protein